MNGLYRILRGRIPFTYKTLAQKVKALFAKGEVGAWYDPSDLTTLFQDSAGTTPVTAVEQPVGLMLDKSKGLVLGPELVTNGDFSNGATGWSTAGFSVVNGAAKADGVTAAPFLQQTVSISAGKTYRVTFTASGRTSGNCYLVLGGTQPTGTLNIVATQTYSCIITTAASNSLLAFATPSGTYDGVIDNISVRELPGNHAFQTTSANRPVLSARVNLLTKTEQFDDAVWSKSNATVNANAVIAPDGTLSADKLINNTTNVNHVVYQPALLTSGITYVFTVYAKAGEHPGLALAISAAYADAGFNLVNGTVIYTGTGLSSASITAVGNGWYRCSITYAATATASINLQILPLNSSNASAFAGNGFSGIYIWGADLRATNTGVNLPPYQRVNTGTDYDTTGFPLYLKANGTNTAMQTNSIDFTTADKMTVWAGVRKLSDVPNSSVMLELSAASDANQGSFILTGRDVYIDGSLVFSNRGSNAWSTAKASPSSYQAPITKVLTGIGNISGDQSILRVDGTQVAINTADQGTGNYGNYPLYLFARAGTSFFFNGQFYGAIIRGAQSSAAEIANAETWINSKTKAY